MNQILITGDEQIESKVTQNIKKEKKVLPINAIVIFYALSIIVLGLCMIGGSIYVRDQINKTVEASIRPEISVERNDDDNTITINVTHIRELKNVVYKWNDNEETIIDAENRKNINETIKLLGGENTLSISVTEENGQIKTFEKTFIAGNIPQLEIVGAVDNGIKIKATSEEEIEYLQYCWDDGEMQKIEVGEKEYEGIINTPKGQHILKVEVIDINGMKADLVQTVVGDTEPTVKVESKLVNGKKTFVIDAEDDENIETLTIIHNSGQEQVIKVNQKTYHKEVVMTDGEVNTIIVTATNLNGLSKTRRIKFDNK